jgi:murein L,D-transpeptidase YafK
MASRFEATTDIGSNGLLSQDQESTEKLQEQLTALRQEVRLRILANIEPESSNKVPLQLLDLSKHVRTALVVDKSLHRIYVFQRDSVDSPARLVHDFYVSTGRKQGNKKAEGDLRTPEGVYFITSWIPDNELPEKYGIGAFPTNYPNALDRKLGKTGDGIWLHGTDRLFYSRPPLDSEGCVVLSNLDLGKIRHLITPGQTPMIITDRIQWVEEQQWKNVRTQVLGSIEQWRKDWESLDVDRYLSHYASNFWSGRFNLNKWRQYKSRIARQKTYQKIALSDMSLFYYPQRASAGKPMVVASFVQNYQSNNYQGEVRKRLYLGKEADGWRILYEGR